MVVNAELPRVFVTVPGIEDLEGVAVLLRAAGAQITERRREFVIEGPLTSEQASAVWRLSRHQDGYSDGNQLELRVVPGGDLEAALALLPLQGNDRNDSTSSGVATGAFGTGWRTRTGVDVKLIAADGAASRRRSWPPTRPCSATSTW